MDPYRNPYAEWIDSPNFWPDRNGHSPNWTGPGTDGAWYVVHITDCTEAEAIGGFKNPAVQRSTHYEIPRNALLIADNTAPFGYRPKGIKQLVDEGNAAWSTGNGDMNENSINTEHEETQADLDNHVGFPDGQLLCSMWLAADIRKRRSIPTDYVIGHSGCTQVEGAVWGYGRGRTATACPDDLPVDLIRQGAEMFLDGRDPHELFGPQKPTPTVKPYKLIDGYVYDGGDLAFYDFNTVTPVGQDATIGLKVSWKSAKYVNGKWLLELVYPDHWALYDEVVNDTDADHDADHASPPDFVSNPHPVVTPPVVPPVTPPVVDPPVTPPVVPPVVDPPLTDWTTVIDQLEDEDLLALIYAIDVELARRFKK